MAVEPEDGLVQDDVLTSGARRGYVAEHRSIAEHKTPKAPLVDGAFLGLLGCAGVIRPTSTSDEEVVPYCFTVPKPPDRRHMPETRSSSSSRDIAPTRTSRKVDGLMINRMDQNQEIVNRYLNDPAFQGAAFKAIVKQIYQQIMDWEFAPAAFFTLSQCWCTFLRGPTQ